jgi:hypothetical protein
MSVRTNIRSVMLGPFPYPSRELIGNTPSPHLLEKSNLAPKNDKNPF